MTSLPKKIQTEFVNAWKAFTQPSWSELEGRLHLKKEDPAEIHKAWDVFVEVQQDGDVTEAEEATLTDSGFSRQVPGIFNDRLFDDWAILQLRNPKISSDQKSRLLNRLTASAGGYEPLKIAMQGFLNSEDDPTLRCLAYPILAKCQMTQAQSYLMSLFLTNGLSSPEQIAIAKALGTYTEPNEAYDYQRSLKILVSGFDKGDPELSQELIQILKDKAGETFSALTGILLERERSLNIGNAELGIMLGLDDFDDSDHLRLRYLVGCLGESDAPEAEAALLRLGEKNCVALRKIYDDDYRITNTRTSQNRNLKNEKIGTSILCLLSYFGDNAAQDALIELLADPLIRYADNGDETINKKLARRDCFLDGGLNFTAKLLAKLRLERDPAKESIWLDAMGIKDSTYYPDMIALAKGTFKDPAKTLLKLTGRDLLGAANFLVALLVSPYQQIRVGVLVALIQSDSAAVLSALTQGLKSSFPGLNVACANVVLDLEDTFSQSDKTVVPNSSLSEAMTIIAEEPIKEFDGKLSSQAVNRLVKLELEKPKQDSASASK